MGIPPRRLSGPGSLLGRIETRLAKHDMEAGRESNALPLAMISTAMSDRYDEGKGFFMIDLEHWTCLYVSLRRWNGRLCEGR
jgi:hypothetical protein